MTESNYICNLCGRTLYCHPVFDELVCLCGNSEIEEFDEDEYNKAMAEADWDEWQEDRRLYGN